MEETGLILILSVYPCQEHRIFSCFCLYDPCSQGGRVRSSKTISAKSIQKTEIVVYMINFATVEELFLVLILLFPRAQRR